MNYLKIINHTIIIINRHSLNKWSIVVNKKSLYIMKNKNKKNFFFIL